MPRITVVLNAHNPGAFLARSLGSVVAQEFSDWECIVVDDASTRPVDPASITRDERVRSLPLESNRGVAVARNIAVAQARSPIVAFLDHDDVWLPGKLAAQVAAHDAAPGAWFSYTGFNWFLPSGQRLECPGREVTYHGLLADEMIHLSSIAVRTDAYHAVGGCDPMLTWAQDHDLFLKLLKLGPPPLAIPDRLTEYHIHGDNRSGNYKGSVAFRKSVLRRHLAVARAKGDAPTEAAALRGLGRADELLAAQAFDAARAAWGRGERVNTAASLAVTGLARSRVRLRRLSR